MRQVEPWAGTDVPGAAEGPGHGSGMTGSDAMRLTCPSCDADLMADELFAAYRVCGACHRHFSIPARDRLALLVDPDTFSEITLDRAADGRGAGAPLPGQTPVGHLADHRDLAAIDEAVVAGTARIGGTEAVAVVLDDHLVGSMLGALMAEKVLLAFEHGLAWRLPVVIACAGGGLRARGKHDPGPLAPVQANRLAASAAQLHLAGVPLISILTHPMSGAIYGAIPAHSDIVLAEPAVRPAGITAILPNPSAEAGDPVDGGWVDAVVDRARLRSTLAGLLDLLIVRGASPAAPAALERHAAGPPVWNALAHVSHAGRPRGVDYLTGLVASLFELRGDRLGGDDRGIVGGIGRIGTLTVMAVATDSRDGSGLQGAIAVRKLTRLARLAGRLEMPLVLLTDGPGEASDESVEVCQAVAGLAEVLSMIPVPVVAVATGEIRGLAAQAMMSGDRTFMQENAVSVASSGGAAAIEPHAPGAGPWRPGSGTVLTAHECERLGLIDGVIPEPAPGAHADPGGAVTMLASAVHGALADVAGVGQRRLLDSRHRRLRAQGQSTPEGQAAVRRELREFQEWQRTLSRSIEEWRDRWELRSPAFRLPSRLRSVRPALADLGDIAQRLRSRRGEQHGPAGRDEADGGTR